MPSKIKKLHVVARFPVVVEVEAATEEERQAAETAWDETEWMCQEVERNVAEITQVIQGRLWEMMRNLGYDHLTLCLGWMKNPASSASL